MFSLSQLLAVPVGLIQIWPNLTKSSLVAPYRDFTFSPSIVSSFRYALTFTINEQLLLFTIHKYYTIGNIVHKQYLETLTLTG